MDDDVGTGIKPEIRAFLMKITTDGHLDLSFRPSVPQRTPEGTVLPEGLVCFPFGNTNSATQIDVLSSGKILAVANGGTAAAPTVVVERFSSTGILDTTFGTAGMATIPVAVAPTITGIAVQSTGNIVVSGTASTASASTIFLTRLTANGLYDATFTKASDKLTDRVADASMAIQKDNKVVVAGSRSGTAGFLVERYTANGALDTSFNTSGTSEATFGNVPITTGGVTIDPNGKIDVAGTVNGNFELARFLSNGHLDTGFGTGGKVAIAFTGGSKASAVTVQSSGRIVVSGEADGGTLMAVARVLGDHTVITAGQSQVTTGASLAADSRLAGPVVASSTLNFSFGSGAAAVHGQIVESIVKETTAGTLDFYYQIVTAAGSMGAIDSLLDSSFAGFTTYVDYRPDSSGTIAPVTAARSSDSKSVTFTFLAGPSGNGLVAAGQTSRTLLVKTNATKFDKLGSIVLNNLSTLGNGYEPVV
jgi:uncharacterized delta-60 repeat protein